MMLKVEILLVLQLVVGVTYCIEETNFIKFTSTIIKNTLGENLCLSYITNKGYDLYLIQQAISNIDTTLMKISFDYDGDAICNSYILISNNFGDLKDIFLTDTKHKLRFKANSRVLIFQTTKQARLKNYFQLNTNLYGCDIFVLEGYPKFFKKEMRFILQMISVRNESVIKSWEISEDFVLGEEDQEKKFLTRQWTLNLLNQKLKASVFDCPPYVSYNRNTKKFEGFEADIVGELLKGYPFEYKVYSINDSVANLYDEMINDVVEKYSNLIMCSPWLNGKYLDKVEISDVYTQHCITFFVPRARKLEPYTFIFMPITLHLGLGVLISAVLVATVYLLIASYGNKLQLNTHRIQSVSEVLFELLRILTLRQAAKSFLTIHDITRLIVVSWILFTLLIATIYSSGISTSMTYPPFSGGLDSFEDIADQNVEWGGSSLDNIATFTGHSNPIFKKIAKLYAKNLTGNLINQRLQEGKNVAIFVKALPIKYIHSEDLEELDYQNLANLKMLPKCVTLYLVGFYFAKNSPIRIFFNKYLSRFLEHGIINYWYTKLNNKPGVLKRLAIFHNRNSELVATQISLQLEELQGAFALLICGWCIASVVFVYEFLRLKYKSPHKHQFLIKSTMKLSNPVDNFNGSAGKIIKNKTKTYLR